MPRFAISKLQITPDNPFYLMGYPGEARRHPATGIHDVPQCNTVILEIDSTKIVFVAMDVVGFSKEVSSQIKQLIAEQFQIEPQYVNLFGIHSHSCPNGTGKSFGDIPDNPDFRNKVIQAIISTIKTGLQNLVEVNISSKVTEIVGYISNRNDLKAPYDHQITELHFHGKNHHLVGVMMTVAAHSTVVGPTNMLCTSDLLGALRSKMSEHYHCDVATVMSAAGDISNRQYRQGDDFNELERTAKGIADQLKANRVVNPINIGPLTLFNVEHLIDYDNTVYFEEFKKQLAESIKIIEDPLTSKDQRKLSEASKSQFESKLAKNHIHKTVVSRIYKTGDLNFVTFSGEMSSKFGIQMKQKDPSKITLVMTCCDDHQGYYIEKENYGKYYETIATDNPINEPEKIVNEILLTL